ncbi:RWD domain-containing protein 1 [Heterocephalus glaber]|uniref:RWD domain-containing protein 1 n=1 Tax=Heterocephalus glaber TaxID=10181 RepID=G5BWZ8_HETGA|nr:RWD domain-containing protein 1 [Heterocephalus glaber]
MLLERRCDPRAAARAAMADYSEEQRKELEALESIYPDSFTVLPENPTSFTVTVTSEAGENDETVQTTLSLHTFLEDAGNNVEVGESLFQELDDLELEDVEDNPDCNPAGPGSDSED